MSAKRKTPPAPLFDAVVFAPDREAIPGTRPLISWNADDEEAFLEAVDAFASRRVQLTRRGHDHGSWAELDLTASGLNPLRNRPSIETLQERWKAARPIVLPGWLEGFSSEPSSIEASRGLVLGERLGSGLPLGEVLDELGLEGPRELTRNPPPQTEGRGSSDERDLDKLVFARTDGPDLWIKSARLSDHESDSSLRLRVSFGAEIDDDASRDEAAHGAVRRLAETLIPGAASIDQHQELKRLYADLAGGELNLTQHIAYWNCPGGGALLHHDAFGEDDCGGQRGVLYTQVAGETAWLALSLDDLASRVEDYCEGLEAGEADWVRKALWPDRRDFERLLARVHNRKAFKAELAKPGCGLFASLVNLGPEFTSFLADAGHGFLLRPGDALLMPSHSLTECTLHSVFCASDRMTYGISAALRRSESV